MVFDVVYDRPRNQTQYLVIIYGKKKGKSEGPTFSSGKAMDNFDV